VGGLNWGKSVQKMLYFYFSPCFENFHRNFNREKSYLFQHVSVKFPDKTARKIIFCILYIGLLENKTAAIYEACPSSIANEKCSHIN
jgi:hypothetical protein